MRLRRVVVHDFRVHRDLDVELAAGLTVVRGPNESGKSTFQRALELALFRRATASGAEIDGLRSWGSPDEDRTSVEVRFTHDFEDRTGEGSIRKDFRGAKGTVRLELDGEVTTDPARADEILGELTGIPSEKFYRSTASVRHHEVDDLARDEGALRDRLQASISGADRGTSVARKKLERALHDLQAKGERNPGRLKVAEQAVAQASTTVDRGEGQLAQLERDRDALGAARQRRAEVAESLTERRSLLEKARQAERLISERDVARERFDRYREAVAVSDTVAALEASHPSSSPLPVLRTLVERMRVLDREIAELRVQLGDSPSAVDFDLRIPEPVWRPFVGLAVVLVVAGAAAGVAGALGGLVPLLAAGGVAIVAGIVTALFARNRRRAVHDVRREKQLRDVEIARRLRGRSQLEEDLKVRERERDEQLARIEQPDLAGAEGLLSREDAHVQEIARGRAQLEGLVGKQPPQALPQLRDAAALEVEQKSGALEALGPIAKEPRARERLEVEVREAEAALERGRNDEAAARARVEQNPVDAEQVALEAERLATWRDELASLQRRSRIYQLALDAIDRAERATMRKATRFLERRMRVDLERLTDGRYSRVAVDDATLDISVFAPELGDWVRVEELSQGTLDQAYLAARLGLVRLVTQDRRPPLVFDDPFVTFDDQRAARGVAILHDLAHDFQVIYLTCSDRYDAEADAVVVLPGPTARDPGADAATVTLAGGPTGAAGDASRRTR